jgi:ubiquinol-cytochrome c reductase cytochrome b subunit
MRRHGISGPIVEVPGEARPFYPYHAAKDTIAMAIVFALLLMCAVSFRVPLDSIADPSDATYVPRPEWYFLSLFQLLKYFPGPLEPVATIVILLLLPFLDRGAGRHLKQRRLVAAAFVLLGTGVVTLTYLGFRDSPAHADPSHWGVLPLAGREFAQDQRCQTCHRIGGAANPIADTRVKRDMEWLRLHVTDPEIIAPGTRKPPPGGMTQSQGRAIASYMHKIRGGTMAPSIDGEHKTAILVYGRFCGNCHMIDGEGVKQGPDLTRAGEKRDAKWLRDWISDPAAIDDLADMPAFNDRLTDEELTAIANYLAARK